MTRELHKFCFNWHRDTNFSAFNSALDGKLFPLAFWSFKLKTALIARVRGKFIWGFAFNAYADRRFMYGVLQSSLPETKQHNIFAKLSTPSHKAPCLMHTNFVLKNFSHCSGVSHKFYFSLHEKVRSRSRFFVLFSSQTSPFSCSATNPPGMAEGRVSRKSVGGDEKLKRKF